MKKRKAPPKKAKAPAPKVRGSTAKVMRKNKHSPVVYVSKTPAKKKTKKTGSQKLATKVAPAKASRAETPAIKKAPVPRKPKPETRGRPKKLSPLEVVTEMCRMNPTDEELSAMLGMCLRTLGNRKSEDPAFVAAMERGRALGRASLRGKQWELALAGSERMLVHLGKNELGQTDKTLLGNDPDNPFLTTFTMDITRPENADG